jgi:hypothetical protein
MAEHRIELLEAVADVAETLGIGADDVGELADLLVVLRQEFVQRGIEQTNRHGLAGHLAQDADEIATLHRSDLR